MVRIQANHFSPNGSSKSVISVPDEWMMFITKTLLTPTHFSWAKDLLHSKAWQSFQQLSPALGLPFILPNSCPTKETPECSFLQEITDQVESEVEEQDLDLMETDSEEKEADAAIGTPQNQNTIMQGSSQSTSAMHKKRKRQMKIPVVESDCRRSDRIKDLSKGFKRSNCPHKECFACAGAPPASSRTQGPNSATQGLRLYQRLRCLPRKRRRLLSGRWQRRMKTRRQAARKQANHPMEGSHQRRKTNRDSASHFFFLVLSLLEDYLNSCYILNYLYPWMFTGLLLLLPAYDGITSSAHTGPVVPLLLHLQFSTGPNNFCLTPYVLCMYGHLLSHKSSNGSRPNT